MEDVIVYCVTGATGYIGSWLVRSLLQRGFGVHATARDPAKALHLLPLWGGGDRLRLFRADLQEEGSFDEAVTGCIGVFHVAAPMQFDVPTKEDVVLLLIQSANMVGQQGQKQGYVCANIIEPAINGTLDLLKSCLKAASVKRVVFTSSISTITAKDTDGKWTSPVDESCQESVDHVWRTKASGWVYVLSKILTEEAAFQFAKEKGVDLVSVITTTVAGPFLTSTVPSSIKVLLSPIKGDPKFSSILSAVNLRMGSIALVHIEDICSAHIFLMEHPGAKGRYMCCAGTCSASELVDHLAKAYPFSDKQRLIEVEQDQQEGGLPCPEISSKKLTALGFDFKYKLKDVISQAVNSCVDCGFLCRTTGNGFEVET